jgi:hypothetical protein
LQRGGLPPIEDIPGLEQGSTGPMDTMVKLLRNVGGEDSRPREGLEEVMPSIMHGVMSNPLLSMRQRMGSTGQDQDEQGDQDSAAPKVRPAGQAHVPRSHITYEYED